MAIKDMISPGIGFNPGSVEFIITRGLTSSAIPPPTVLPGSSLIRQTSTGSSLIRQSTTGTSTIRQANRETTLR